MCYAYKDTIRLFTTFAHNYLLDNSLCSRFQDYKLKKYIHHLKILADASLSEREKLIALNECSDCLGLLAAIGLLMIEEILETSSET